MYMERYSQAQRWTALLQQQLGTDYCIVEEGLNGRTTNLDYQDVPGRNGESYLLPCLYSHAPLDLVVLFLGANDLKNEFGRTVKDITAGLSVLIDIIQSTLYGPDMQSPPQVLLVGYPAVAHENGFVINGESVLKGAVEKSKQFNLHFSELAIKKQCHYVNAAPHIALSDIDGIHLDEKGHRVFASLLSHVIRDIFKGETDV
jgi:lysophospholipase L1-like esterase